jgi:asparagine synthase (glutamine-hydrolysing)
MLAQNLLPNDLDMNRKHGLTMPLSDWFKIGWRDFVEETVRTADSDLFDRNVINRLLRGQRRGLNNTQRLFGLVMFELWRREYKICLLD